jgi:phospholipid/cholesterol/gamma-HCH transport system ATP-binding protein
MIGLIRPDSGEVYVENGRIDQLSEGELVEVRKRFGFLFQMGALFDSMSAGENVAFPLREHSRKSREEVEHVVSEKLSLVGLEGVQPKRPGDLSGGQKKRVALARAIALNPQIVLYDEPTTGLDPIRADTINNLIIKMKDQLGITGVVVTHDMTSAFKVADRVLMLHNGSFIADGTPEDIRNSKNKHVRNFVNGTAEEEPDLA